MSSEDIRKRAITLPGGKVLHVADSAATKQLLDENEALRAEVEEYKFLYQNCRKVLEPTQAKLDIAAEVMKQNFEVPNPNTAYVLTSNGTRMELSKKREKEVLKAFKELGITGSRTDE